MRREKTELQKHYRSEGFPERQTEIVGDKPEVSHVEMISHEAAK